MKEIFGRTIKGPWVTSGEDVQYRIERGADGTWLYFQQTSSKGDWLHNFDGWAKPYRWMGNTWYAHRGFVRLWHSVRDEIMAALSADKAVNVAGYSQGAALAVLAHEDLAYHGKVVRGYGFACPRVVWMRFDREVEGRWKDFTRYSVRGDIVTMLPPWLLGYEHVGKEVKVGPVALPSARNHYPDRYEEWL